MTGAQYRSKAAELFEQAKRETDRVAQQRMQKLALAYVDLGEQADKKVGYQFDHGVPLLAPELTKK